MAHSTLSEKLDHISGNELGFPFDEDALWNRLESKLEAKGVAIQRRWMIAACLFILVFLAPITLLKEWQQPIADEAIVEATMPKVEEQVVSMNESADKRITPGRIAQTKILSISKKGVTPEIATFSNISLAPMLVKESKVELENEPQFAAQDISIIQASLERSSVEKGRNMSIRAQWQSSSTEVNVNHQALKIKLYEKEN